MDSVPPGGLGGTFGGNPVACAAASRCSRRGARATTSANAPSELGRADPGPARGARGPERPVGEVRGLGPMLALELAEPTPDLAKARDDRRGARARPRPAVLRHLRQRHPHPRPPHDRRRAARARASTCWRNRLATRRWLRPISRHTPSCGRTCRLDGVRKTLRRRRRRRPASTSRSPPASSSRCSGPSGSGKTTTLRLIAGFERPDEGRIELGGADVTNRAALRARRQHGLPGLRALPAHDGRRERRLRPAREARSRRRERKRRVEESCESCGCPTSATASPCSSPAASASASRSPARSSTQPQVLLLDEPLGALDLKLRQEMQIELKRIQREVSDVGITFIYVTHDQEEALTMSDRLAVFNEGRIEQIGAPAEVYERPATEFVAGFVGVSNVLERDGRTVHRPPGEDPDASTRRGSELGETPSRVASATSSTSACSPATSSSSTQAASSQSSAEPRDVIAGGARVQGPPRPPRVATRAHLRDRVDAKEEEA